MPLGNTRTNFSFWARSGSCEYQAMMSLLSPKPWKANTRGTGFLKSISLGTTSRYSRSFMLTISFSSPNVPTAPPLPLEGFAGTSAAATPAEFAKPSRAKNMTDDVTTDHKTRTGMMDPTKECR